MLKTRKPVMPFVENVLKQKIRVVALMHLLLYKYQFTIYTNVHDIEFAFSYILKYLFHDSLNYKIPTA
jgi:hypothetical protein